MKKNCNNVISLKQYGPTCWFNSILMSLLYSDESRKLLLKKSKNWNKKIEVLNTIKYILHNKYLRTDKIFKDYEYFDKIRPEFILKELYKYNNKKFIINPDINKSGYKSALYIRKIYKLLGVKVLYLDLDFKTKKLYYSLFNNVEVVSCNDRGISIIKKIKNFSTIIKYFKNPDVIIINIKENIIDNSYPSWYKINDNSLFYNGNTYNGLKNFSTLNNEVNNNKDIYVQDSVLLGNYNLNIGGHSIAGITCKGDKYVYNGWTRTTIDPNIKTNSQVKDWKKMLVNDDYWYFHIPSGQIVKETDSSYPNHFPTNEFFGKKNIEIPCELMKFSWDVKKNNEFCLNPKKCILDIMNVNDLCFSFNKGDAREVIYVKKIKDNKLNIKNDKKCPTGKVINPLTNRCIKIKTINKLPKKTLSKPEKICPNGKVINPKTNRCIKIKTINKLPEKTLSKAEKICPDGKVINPKTNRCIKNKK